MATLNTGCLYSVIETDVSGITTGYAIECFMLISNAVDSLTSNRNVALPVSGCLPSLWPTQTIPEGHIAFLEDIAIPVIAAKEKWIALDQRVFRKDSPSSVLWTWGQNICGQLGDSSTTSRSSPGTTAGCGTNWSKIGGGTPFSAGIKTDGTLWTWGHNLCGNLGTGTTTTRTSPGQEAGASASWKELAVGFYAMAAIKCDGTLWTWGNNTAGELGTGNTTSRSSPDTTVGGGINWAFVSLGDCYSAAIKCDGTLWTWGKNTAGQLGTGNTTSRSSPGTVAGGGTTWCAISAGAFSGSAIKTDGTLWTWGTNTYGELGDGTAVAKSSPVTTAGGGTTWCAVSSGMYHSAAIKTDGTLWTWGFNNCGQLGDGTIVNKSSPVSVAGGGTTWCGVSAGQYFTLAVKTDGTLWSWGYNTTGQLGIGTTTPRSSPGTLAGGGTCWYRAAASKINTNAVVYSPFALALKYG